MLACLLNHLVIVSCRFATPLRFRLIVALFVESSGHCQSPRKWSHCLLNHLVIVRLARPLTAPSAPRRIVC